MNLIRTTEGGSKIYSTVEQNNGVPKLVLVEKDASGNEVRRWSPSFEEIAGHSPAAKVFGR